MKVLWKQSQMVRCAVKFNVSCTWLKPIKARTLVTKCSYLTCSSSVQLENWWSMKDSFSHAWVKQMAVLKRGLSSSALACLPHWATHPVWVNTDEKGVTGFFKSFLWQLQVANCFYKSSENTKCTFFEVRCGWFVSWYSSSITFTW